MGAREQVRTLLADGQPRTTREIFDAIESCLDIQSTTKIVGQLSTRGDIVEYDQVPGANGRMKKRWIANQRNSEKESIGVPHLQEIGELTQAAMLPPFDNSGGVQNKGADAVLNEISRIGISHQRDWRNDVTRLRALANRLHTGETESLWLWLVELSNELERISA